jgi:dTDP-4-dehydrorhamnose reductase
VTPGSNGSPRILLTGSGGQVGWELVRTLAPLGALSPFDRRSLDLTDLDNLKATVRSAAPDVIVNAAAYTQVDLAETESDAAHRINADAPGALARAAADSGAIFVHYSTDYVFDGSAGQPYTETDRVSPANAYGRSKAAGDEAVLASGADAYLFRVSWVYGNRGRNFLRTIRRLAAERDQLTVVADQYGSPTWSRQIAEATASALAQILSARRERRALPATGVYNMAAGDYTSWHGFAQAIVDSAASPGRTVSVLPIAGADYPTAARRPVSSRLDVTRLAREFGITLPSWREQLALCLASDALAP